MSKSEKGDGIGDGVVEATSVVVAIIVIAVAGRFAGLGSFASLLGAVAAVFAIWITIVRWRGGTTDPGSEAKTEQQWSRQPVRGHGGAPQEPKSAEEYLELFKRDLEYTEAGKHDYSNTTVWICRVLKRALSYLPISEDRHRKVYRWARRFEVPIAVLAYLWVIIYFGQTIDTLLPIERYPEIRSLLYVIDPPAVINPFVDLGIYIGPAILLFLAIMSTRSARTVSTCKACDEAFSLAHKGCYYRQEGKRDREKEVNDKTHHWSEYEGSKVLRCTNPDCGELEIRDANWDDKTLIQKYYYHL